MTTGLFQSIINSILLKMRFEINDGMSEMFSLPKFFTVTRINKGGNLRIGKNTSIEPFTVINVQKKVEIGDKTMIGSSAFISDFLHNTMKTGDARIFEYIQKDCIIGNGVQIGFGAVIVSSEIEDDCVIGANSVVINKKIEKGNVFVGDSRSNFKQVRLPDLQ